VVLSASSPPTKQRGSSGNQSHREGRRRKHVRNLPPAIGSPVVVPVRERLLHRLLKVVGCLEPASLEGKALQLLPPWLDHVHPTRVFGQELRLDLWPGEQRGLHVPAGMRGEVVLNHQPSFSRKPVEHLLEQLEMARAITSLRDDHRRLAGRGLEGPMHPARAAPPIIRRHNSCAQHRHWRSLVRVPSGSTSITSPWPVSTAPAESPKPAFHRK